ncbi:hypothetical protein J1N35_045329 [Gossypium stocksii]|uniref:ABC-2 type transporter transmembrane domain-containing protein n=1 Tax=Gossypium stocksii TaxID=47602 RepID=A0A9D3ZGY7_9ROSI|nr:hypothetical protein J1N35_045329 [Gossypium stocksii]
MQLVTDPRLLRTSIGRKQAIRRRPYVGSYSDRSIKKISQIIASNYVPHLLPPLKKRVVVKLNHIMSRKRRDDSVTSEHGAMRFNRISRMCGSHTSEDQPVIDTMLRSQQNVFNVFGSMYAALLFLGMDSSSSVQPFVPIERVVMYRERFTGMYSCWAYALAQVTIEVPYLFIQALVFEAITYPMIGYYGSPYKVFWYFYAVFCTHLYFTFFGMLFVSLTPEVKIAGALSSAFYPLLNLFSGFLIPQPQIPKWWMWLYHLTPLSWTLNCLLTSQYDVSDEIMVFGEAKTVASLLKNYFGFHHDRLPITAILLISYSLIFATLFAFFLSRLNFERRRISPSHKDEIVVH